MPALVIIGAGGFGREVCEWARQGLLREPGWELRGFLDDNPEALEGFDAGARVLGRVADYVPREDDRFLCAVGSPALKRRLVTPIVERGGRFATLVHPSVVLGRNVVLGEGTILCPRVVVTCDVKIGRWVSLNVGTAVGHDARVGDYVQTSSFCDITGGVVVGEGVLMGSHATVLPRVKVGAWAVVGAGSVVLRSVRERQTVFGSPARTLPIR